MINLLNSIFHHFQKAQKIAYKWFRITFEISFQKQRKVLNMAFQHLS